MHSPAPQSGEVIPDQKEHISSSRYTDGTKVI